MESVKKQSKARNWIKNHLMLFLTFIATIPAAAMIIIISLFFVNDTTPGIMSTTNWFRYLFIAIALILLYVPIIIPIVIKKIKDKKHPPKKIEPAKPNP